MSRTDLKIQTVAALALAAGLAIPIVATAHAETETEHNATESFAEVNPCTGEQGILTITYNSVSHENSDAAGGSHETDTSTGTFVFAQDNGVTFTGHFTMWDGENEKPKGAAVETFTFSAHGDGDDGSTLQFNANGHETTNPDGTTTSEFDRLSCH